MASAAQRSTWAKRPASIDYDPAKLTVQDFEQAVDAAGHKIE